MRILTRGVWHEGRRGVKKRSVACETPDFDGDSRMDLGVYRETTGQYLYQQSSNGNLVTVDLVPPGQPGGDVAIPA